MEKTMKRYGVNHCFSTSYHPQTSGQVKNTNRALKRILEKTAKDNPAMWSRKLDNALWAFRTAYKTPTSTTPYKLIYGRNCHLPFEIEHRAYWALKNYNPDLIDAGEKRMFQLHDSSLGPLTPPSSSLERSTCPSYSPKPSGSVPIHGKAECSNTQDRGCGYFMCYSLEPSGSAPSHGKAECSNLGEFPMNGIKASQIVKPKINKKNILEVHGKHTYKTQLPMDKNFEKEKIKAATSEVVDEGDEDEGDGDGDTQGQPHGECGKGGEGGAKGKCDGEGVT
ncbi:reverse transcriptase domain-containing protein [Tanacetum coccineum]